MHTFRYIHFMRNWRPPHVWFHFITNLSSNSIFFHEHFEISSYYNKTTISLGKDVKFACGCGLQDLCHLWLHVRGGVWSVIIPAGTASGFSLSGVGEGSGVPGVWSLHFKAACFIWEDLRSLCVSHEQNYIAAKPENCAVYSDCSETHQLWQNKFVVSKQVVRKGLTVCNLFH